MLRRRSVPPFVLILVGFTLGVAAPLHAVSVTVDAATLATIPENFFGTHYNGPTHLGVDPSTGGLQSFPSSHADPGASAALSAAGIGLTRVFVDAPTVNPAPGVYDWSDIDTAVDEIVAAGMSPMLTLHQREGAWHVGDASNPWWNDPAGRSAWSDLAGAMATRYGDRTPYFELLNEPNHLHPTRDSYMGLDRSADLYLDGAAAIRAAAPDSKIGGPASFGSWEPATWAKRVLARPGGESLLDFVSYHIYATGVTTATDADLFEMAKWWETAPQAIRADLEAVSGKSFELHLTEFNASSVFRRDGELWTDPRNIDATGGVLAALGWLYSARGGADGAVRFGTTGGYGLIRWPPQYELQHAYYAVRLLHETAGLAPGAELVETTITDVADGLEAFTIRDADGERLVLINTGDTETISIDVTLGAPIDQSLDVYRYDETRTEAALSPLTLATAIDGQIAVAVPPRSMTVLTPTAACSACGDYDGDGDITTADYALWAQQVGSQGALSADGNSDGAVTAADYTVWRDAYTAAASNAAPEPAAWLTASLLSVAATRQRRRPLHNRLGRAA